MFLAYSTTSAFFAQDPFLVSNRRKRIAGIHKTHQRDRCKDFDSISENSNTIDTASKTTVTTTIKDNQTPHQTAPKPEHHPIITTTMPSFLDKLERMPFFSPKYKLPVHIVQLILVIAAVGMTVPRLFIRTPGPRTRTNTIALSMGAKSLIILAYVILSDHVARFAKWRSLKAYTILSGLEVVFWAGVAGLMFQANLKRCEGVTCGLSWAVIALAMIINQTEVYTFIVSYLEWRAWKRDGGNTSNSTLPTTSTSTNTKATMAYNPVHTRTGSGDQDLPPYGGRYEMSETTRHARSSSDGSDVALKPNPGWDNAHIREHSRSPSPSPLLYGRQMV